MHGRNWYPRAAAVIGGTNIGVRGYPDHTCRKPYGKPSRPYQLDDPYMVDSYNREVDRYNEEVASFRRCIGDYVESASNDMKRIEAKATDAIGEVDRLARE